MGRNSVTRKMIPITDMIADRVWSKSSKNIEPCLRVKFPPRIQVWGMISFQAVSELHLIPKGQMVNGAYYRDSILAKTCLDAVERKRKTGSILEWSMIPNMSEFFFHAGWCTSSHRQIDTKMLFTEATKLLV